MEVTVIRIISKLPENKGKVLDYFVMDFPFEKRHDCVAVTSEKFRQMCLENWYAIDGSEWEYERDEGKIEMAIQEAYNEVSAEIDHLEKWQIKLRSLLS